MSSGFKVADEIVWGTNGAVEGLLETLGRYAANRYGTEDRLAAFCRDHADQPAWGWVIHLDEVLTDPTDRQKFRNVLDAAIAELSAGDEYTEYGKNWLRYAVGWLHERLEGPTASTAPPP